MNYIYDIILNFHSNYYPFYEWKKTDEIVNIKKIPLLKVNIEDYLSLKYNDIIVDNLFLNNIYNLTTTYNKNKYEYVCLISNGEEAMGLLFNKDGLLLKRSSLLLDEEEEVIEEGLKQNKAKINFIKNIIKKEERILRNKKEQKETIINFLNSIKDDLTLKYLYYEFYEKENNNQNIKKILLEKIEESWDYRHQRLYEVIKLMNKIKN